MGNDSETCCAVCGDEIYGDGFDNGFVVTCADCSDDDDDDGDGDGDGDGDDDDDDAEDGQ